MIDGVKSSCIGLAPALWQRNPALNFGISVSESTGELLTQKREANVNGLRFIISSTDWGGLSCSLAGSLHKYKNADSTNYNDFIFSDLSDTLDSLSQKYDIDIEHSPLHGIEIGVNIELDYSPEIVFKKAVCHKGTPFESINAQYKRLGVVCTHTDYTIKLYDKGYQCKIDNKYILRYEVKLLRQRILHPYGINTLADLKKPEKVAPLIHLLRKSLQEIVFFDYSFKPKDFTKCKLLSWQQYGNPRYWESLDPNNYYKARKKLSELTEKYGCIDWKGFMLKKVTQKWFDLLDYKYKKVQRFPCFFIQMQAQKKARISELECMWENIANGDVQKRKEKRKIPLPEIPSKQYPEEYTEKTEDGTGFCVSCGRELTGQKKGSRFCSEKIYGHEARKCRNKDSNKRLAVKRKIKRAAGKDLKLVVIYQDKGKESKAILAASKVVVSREWLDIVKSVEVYKSNIHIRGVP